MVNKNGKIGTSRWFNSWPFDPQTLEVTYITPWKSHVNSPSQKGQWLESPGRDYIYIYIWVIFGGVSLTISRWCFFLRFMFTPMLHPFASSPGSPIHQYPSLTCFSGPGGLVCSTAGWLVEGWLESKISPTYPWKVPRMFHQQFMKEICLFGGFGEVWGIFPGYVGKIIDWSILGENSSKLMFHWGSIYAYVHTICYLQNLDIYIYMYMSIYPVKHVSGNLCPLACIYIYIRTLCIYTFTTHTEKHIFAFEVGGFKEKM